MERVDSKYLFSIFWVWGVACYGQDVVSSLDCTLCNTWKSIFVSLPIHVSVRLIALSAIHGNQYLSAYPSMCQFAWLHSLQYMEINICQLTHPCLSSLDCTLCNTWKSIFVSLPIHVSVRLIALSAIHGNQYLSAYPSMCCMSMCILTWWSCYNQIGNLNLTIVVNLYKGYLSEAVVPSYTISSII